MSRVLWRWVFETTPDEQLIAMVRALNITVPGFREITARNLPRVRQRLISILLDSRKLLKIVKLINTRVRQDPNAEQWREQDLTVLVSSVNTVDEVRGILESLLSSEDEKHHKTAEDFFAELDKTGRLHSLQHAWAEKKESALHEAQLQAEHHRLRAELEDVRKKYEAQVKENGKLKGKLNDIQNKLDSAAKLLAKKDREWELERSELLRRIQKLEETLQAREADLRHKEEQQRELEQKLLIATTPSNQAAAGLEDANKPRDERLKRVVIIHDFHRIQERIKRAKRQDCEFVLLHAGEGVSMGDIDLSAIDEIWVLRLQLQYHVEHQLRRQLLPAWGSRVKFVSTLDELVDLLDQEGSWP